MEEISGRIIQQDRKIFLRQRFPIFGGVVLLAGTDWDSQGIYGPIDFCFSLLVKTDGVENFQQHIGLDFPGI